MPEQRKRLHCVAEITLSTTFLLASEVPAIAAFARSGLHQERNSKKRERGTINIDLVPRSRSHASGYQKPMPEVKAQLQIWLCSGPASCVLGRTIIVMNNALEN